MVAMISGVGLAVHDCTTSASRSSSGMPTTEQMTVSLSSATNCPVSGGMAVLKAWGKTMSRKVLKVPSPRERAASSCPCPTALTPERRISLKNALWFRVRVRMPDTISGR